MTPRRILAARGGALGDFILSLPSLAAIRSQWPDAEIRLLSSPRHAALARSASLCHDHRDPASAAASFSQPPSGKLPSASIASSSAAAPAATNSATRRVWP